jgi:hypothetical protein
MKLRILDVAEADLLRGFRFYQRKSRGVGWYFLESLYAEIDSLHTRSISVISGCCRVVFRMPFIIVSRSRRFRCGGCWIAGEIPGGFGNN